MQMQKTSTYVETDFVLAKYKLSTTQFVLLMGEARRFQRYHPESFLLVDIVYSHRHRDTNWFEASQGTDTIH